MEMPPGPGLPPPELRSILFSNPFPFLRECAERYGHVFSLDIGSMGANNPSISGLWHFVWGKEANSLLGSLEYPDVSQGEINRAASQANIQPMSICLLDGQEHQRLKRELSPIANDDAENLRIYCKHFNKSIAAKKKKFDQQKTVRAYDFFRDIFLSAAFGSCFGEAINHDDTDKFSSVLQQLHTLLLPEKHTIRKNDLLRTSNEALALIAQEISRRKNDQGRLKANMPNDSYLDSMLLLQRESGNLSNLDIRDNIFAGWTMLSRLYFSNGFWGVLRSVTHTRETKPFLQASQTLHNELKGSEPPPNFLRTDKQLSAFVFELLRINPTRYIGTNRIAGRHIEFGQYSIPTGSILSCSDYLTHMDAELHTNPDTFSPDRFLDSPPESYSWVPFGLGQRKCPYQNGVLPSLTYAISALLYHFEFKAEKISFTPEFANQIFIPTSNNQLTIRAI